MPARLRRRATGAAGAVLAFVLLVAGCSGGGPGPSGGAGGQAAPLPAGPAVDTTTGTVRGVVQGRTHRWLGIRYAQAPTGPRRWTLPEPVPDTPEVLDASRPGPACPQPGEVVGGTDEDCLFLDVTAPARPAAGPRPVLVWWHGGGFTRGAGSQHDAQRLADQGDVVVVTASYRLGALGYLALPGLPGGGTFGLADQLLALRWANDNAAAFGGDPDDVTLAGESAGAVSVCAALTSPAAVGLLDRAVMSSGTCRLEHPPGTLTGGAEPVRPLVPLAEAEATGARVAGDLGCTGADPLACLRDQPVEALVAQGASYGAPLAFGTTLLPTDPALAVAAGDVLDVPVLVGGNRDEHRSSTAALLLGDPGLLTGRTYPALVERSFGAAAPAVLAAYPGGSDAEAALAWATLVTDAAWACTTDRAERELAAAGNEVWSYEFADRTAPDVNGVAASGLPLGAAHASDVPYLFDLGGADLLAGPGQRALAAEMVALWTSFARTGSPTAPGLPTGAGAWALSTAERTSVLRLDQQQGAPVLGLVDQRDEHRCDLWDSLDLP